METTQDNLSLTEEQEMVLEQVGKLVQDKIEPVALHNDEHREFCRESFTQLAEMGMLGLPVGEDSGGAGFGMLAFAVALEQIARACGSSARLLLSQAGLCGTALEGLAAGAERCQALLMGEAIGAFVGAHSGVTATADGDGFVLDGRADLVTAAMEADTVIAAAVDADGGALLVALDAAACQRTAVAALGFRATAPGAVDLTGVRVGAGDVLARGDDARRALQRAAIAACVGGGAICVGMGEASIEASLAHAHERIAFGKPLYAQQAVTLKLVDASRAVDAARHQVYHAARLVDGGQDAARAAAFARLSAVEAALLAADEGIQVHGGFGYTVEYHVERHYRDAKCLEVMDGGAEALRDGIAAALAR